MVTSYPSEQELRASLHCARVHVRPSAQPTTFENVYSGATRRQRVLARAEPLSLSQVPDGWRVAPVVLLGPVAGELEDNLFGAFGGALLGLAPQGLMRAWDEAGVVRPKRWARAEALSGGVDVLVFSEDDVHGCDELVRYLGLAPVVAVTHSERGATVYEQGVGRHYPAFACETVDPTGAGDTWAAAFLLELDRTGNVSLAAEFANAAASLAIEAPGASRPPTRADIERRIASGERLPA